MGNYIYCDDLKHKVIIWFVRKNVMNQFVINMIIGSESNSNKPKPRSMSKLGLGMRGMGW